MLKANNYIEALRRLGQVTDWSKPKRLITFGDLLGVATMVAVVTLLWRWIDPSSVEQKTDFLRTIAQVVGGIALLGGLLFTFLTVRASQQTLALTRKGQAADRFFEAVEHLGHDNIDVRVGAVYVLGTLVRDSPDDEHLFNQAMRVLISFVRRRTLGAVGISIKLEEETKEDRRSRFILAESANRVDIQAAITVLGDNGERIMQDGKFKLNFGDLHLLKH